jgi:uncharacterized protein YqcC (DUF446 family)
MTTKPDRLLTQNSELRKVGVWNWTLPAHTLKLTDGSWFNTCPNAGACGRVCYAKMGTYLFSNVRRRHLQNLEYVLYNENWWQEMAIELDHKRFLPTNKPHDLPHDENDQWLHQWVLSGGRAVRIHDAGDFFSAEYLFDWIDIAYEHDHILFYAYTKEVEMLKKSSYIPKNLRVVFSYGGKQDHMIDRERDRHADVFPTKEALEAAGYFDQSDNDLLAVVAPTNKIGIVANNLPVANKRFAGRTMSEL